MTDENKAVEQEQPQMGLERIFVKDLSVEVPSSEVFTKDWEPELDVKVGSSFEQVAQDHFEVVLSVTVTATNDNETAFVAEVHQAGIFMLKNIPDEQMGGVLGAYCPNVLFPYAREAISDMVSRASFPQLLLSPINFDEAYLQSLQEELEEQEESEVKPS